MPLAYGLLAFAIKQIRALPRLHPHAHGSPLDHRSCYYTSGSVPADARASTSMTEPYPADVCASMAIGSEPLLPGVPADVFWFQTSIVGIAPARVAANARSPGPVPWREHAHCNFTALVCSRADNRCRNCSEPLLPSGRRHRRRLAGLHPLGFGRHSRHRCSKPPSWEERPRQRRSLGPPSLKIRVPRAWWYP